MDDERPTLACFVCFPLSDRWYTKPALVALEVAAELHAHGWIIVGPDPAHEDALAAWERNHYWLKRLRA